jgi:hypothetical protein
MNQGELIPAVAIVAVGLVFGASVVIRFIRGTWRSPELGLFLAEASHHEM